MDDDSDLEKFGFKPTNKHCKIAQLEDMPFKCSYVPDNSFLQVDDESEISELSLIGFSPTSKHWKIAQLEKESESSNN
jgi:hypothetical protein